VRRVEVERFSQICVSEAYNRVVGGVLSKSAAPKMLFGREKEAIEKYLYQIAEGIIEKKKSVYYYL